MNDNLQSPPRFVTPYAAANLSRETLKRLRPVITLVWPVAAFIANAGDRLGSNAKWTANQSTNSELRLLQGTWQGAVASDESHQQITITITGDSFHFHRDTNFWFDTTIALPAGAYPKQLHATIRHSSPPEESNGKVVMAIYKVEGETLTLATGGHGADKLPKSFETAENEVLTRYELRKVQPEIKNPQPPKAR